MKKDLLTTSPYTVWIQNPNYGVASGGVASSSLVGTTYGYGYFGGGYTTTLPVVAQDPTLNWKEPDSLIYPFEVGDIVWTHYDGEPQKQYRVLVKRESSASNEGGYQVKVGALDTSTPKASFEGIYLGACYFFPISVRKAEAKAERDPRYPHDCQFCGAPAFIGPVHVDCKANCRALKPAYR